MILSIHSITKVPGVLAKLFCSVNKFTNLMTSKTIEADFDFTILIVYLLTLF